VLIGSVAEFLIMAARALGASSDLRSRELAQGRYREDARYF